MAFKMIDVKCTDCGHVQEYLADTKDNMKSWEELEVHCEKCNKQSFEKVEISVGTGHGKHISWSSWNI